MKTLLDKPFKDCDLHELEQEISYKMKQKRNATIRLHRINSAIESLRNFKRLQIIAKDSGKFQSLLNQVKSDNWYSDEKRFKVKMSEFADDLLYVNPPNFDNLY